MKNNLVFLLMILSFSAISQNGLHFDNSNDLVETTYPGILGNNAITVEAWIQPDASSGESIITAWGSDATNGGRFTFRVHQSTSTDVIRIEIKGGGLNGTIDVSDGMWHHVAVTYDPTASFKYKLYVDGVLDVEGNISQGLNIVADVNLRMGRRISTIYTGWYGGYMDEVRVWSVARSLAEIQADMNAEFCTAPAGLEAYYKLNEGVAEGSNASENMAIDAAGSNDGTLTGFDLTGMTSNWVLGSNIVPSQVNVTNTYTECPGFQVTVAGNVYSTTGIYSDSLIGSNGCDSIITTNLTIESPIYNNLYITECYGGSYTVNGMTYSATGIYNNIVSNGASNGCDSTIVLDLTILPLIDPSVTVTGWTLSANQSNASYQWIDCSTGDAIVGDTNQSFTAPANGDYAVIVSDVMCSDTSVCTTLSDAGIIEMDNASILLFPNPANEQLSISFNEAAATLIAIKDMNGAVIKMIETNDLTCTFNVADLAAGTYIVHIIQDTAVSRKVFIKN